MNRAKLNTLGLATIILNCKAVMRSCFLPIGLVAAISLSSQPAFAKQCVWNKAGFILNVTWVDPNGNVARVDSIPLAQGTCTGEDDTTQYTAILSIKDGRLADAVTRGAVFAAAAAAGVLVTVGSGGTATAAGVGGAAFIAELANKGIPDPSQVFWTGVPSQDGHWLDVWGTIWSPQVGQGAKI